MISTCSYLLHVKNSDNHSTTQFLSYAATLPGGNRKAQFFHLLKERPLREGFDNVCLTARLLRVKDVVGIAHRRGHDHLDTLKKIHALRPKEIPPAAFGQTRYLRQSSIP